MDIDQAKLTLAQQSYGADFVFDSRAPGVAEQIQQQTGGLIGVVDFVGSQQTSGLAVSVLRTGGTYVNVGLFGGGLQIPLAVLVQRQLVLRGSYVGTPGNCANWPRSCETPRSSPLPSETSRSKRLTTDSASCAPGRSPAGSSISTVKSLMMRKMNAGSLPELVRTAAEHGPNTAPHEMGSLLDELLAAVDVEGRAGDRRVRHEVDGQRGDVGRADDASDASGVSLAARTAR